MPDIVSYSRSSHIFRSKVFNRLILRVFETLRKSSGLDVHGGNHQKTLEKRFNAVVLDGLQQRERGKAILAIEHIIVRKK